MDIGSGTFELKEVERMLDRRKYIPWYRLSESVLDRLLPNRTDREIMRSVFSTDWLILPTPEETNRRQAVERPDPNIFIAVDGEVRIGLVCNTLASQRKMENILLEYHSSEKDEFLKLLRHLENDFETSVGKKVYEHHFLESPTYSSAFRHRSNTMDEKLFEKIFSLAHAIHEEGRSLRREKYKRILPTVTLARSSFPQDEKVFSEKLASLRPLYELGLSIRTTPEIKRDLRARGVISRLRCPNSDCGWGPIPQGITTRCPDCGEKLIPV